MTTEFVWTNQLVKEYAEWEDNTYHAPGKGIDAFIASKQPKWEILSFEWGGRILNYNAFSSCFECPGYSFSYNYALNECKNCNIHSVLRLSDGEVFTIGDRVQANYEGEIFAEKIDKIEVFKDHVYIYFFTPGKAYSKWGIGDIEKVKTKWAVKKKIFELVESPSGYRYENPDNWTIFETREAAVDYIKQNKTMFCFAELEKFLIINDSVKRYLLRNVGFDKIINQKQ